ncbi:DUF3160 domain-containing protein [bacterium]|nr:DUF3160 domain-containing protein [bacterium]MBU1936309.1 DUF3160 domain-containing protein [bacterium]
MNFYVLTRYCRSTLVGIIILILFPSVLSAQIKPNVHPYQVEPNLTNVVNLSNFKEGIEYYTRTEFSFSEAQKEKLVQNRFVVAPSDAEQFFHIYESSHFGIKPRIPNFITSDALLQLYHLFYDFTLKAIESEELIPAVKKLTQTMLDETQKQGEGISDSELKAACLKNISFFAVAARLLSMKDTLLPKNCIPEIEGELQKIENHEGRDKSDIFQFEHDYTQYIVRGHYTENEELAKYFRAMMWYGTSAFPFEVWGERTEQQILQAFLITHLLFNSELENEPLIQLWDKVYSITAFYVGCTDDLNPYHFRELMEEVYGQSPSLNDFADKEKLNLFYEKSETLPRPKIATQLGLQFQFMGQRFIPDSYITQELVKWPNRPWPKGLDVMAVLGSERAAKFLDTLYNEPEKWSDYLPKRVKLKEEFANLDEKDWYKNLFYGWLYTLKVLLEERGSGYPNFMQNAAWTDKELNTALASWAELRHDVILYGNASMAEGCGDFEKVLQPKGYVEPVPEFYGRLQRLLELNKQILADKRFLTEDIEKIFTRFEDLLSFLKTISEKELTNKTLTDEEYERIQWFGRELERLSVSIVETDKNLAFYYRGTDRQAKRDSYMHLRGWYDVLGSNRDVACIADVHTSGADCLEEAVGHINTIYVIVPIEGKLHITRGGVFSYYEFQYSAAHRLTDEAWQEMIKRGRAPEPPSWTSSFLTQ